MSRLKNFPEKIYASFGKEGKLILVTVPEKAIEALRYFGQRVQLYTVPEAFRKLPKSQNQPQTPAPAPEPDLPPNKAPVVKGEKSKRHRRTRMEIFRNLNRGALSPVIVESEPAGKQWVPWVCNDCDVKFSGFLTCKICPNCKGENLARINVIEIKADKSAAGAEKEVERQGLQAEGKPKWKCPVPLCGWTGDNPPKRLGGRDKGKFFCPFCGATVVKDE